MASNVQIIREYVACIIAERRASNDLDTMTADAKERLDAALAAQLGWREEETKKSAFLAALVDVGAKPDTAKARKVKDASPAKFKYDPTVIARGKSIGDEVKKAKANYAKFDWTADAGDDDDFAWLSDERPTSSKPPSGEARVYLSPRDMTPNTPYRWDKAPWGEAVSGVAMGSFDDSEAREGSHPGEARLALIFGAQVQGDSVSFDLVDQQGDRWEVKGLETPVSQIRPGQGGKAAFARPARILFSVMEQVDRFTQEVIDVGVKKVCDTDKQVMVFKRLHTFLKNNLRDIERKEISISRFVGIQSALKAVQYLRDVWSIEVAKSAGSGKLRVGDAEIDVTRTATVQILRNMRRDNPKAAELLKTFEPREVCLSHLDTIAAFDNPSRWFSTWKQEIDVQKIFAETSGLMIATAEAFYMVPRVDLESQLTLKRISQDAPRYTYNVLAGNGDESD